MPLKSDQVSYGILNVHFDVYHSRIFRWEFPQEAGGR